MNDSASQIWHLFDSPIECITVRTVPELLALSNDSSEQKSSLLGITSCLVKFQILQAICLINHYSAATLRNKLASSFS